MVQALLDMRPDVRVTIIGPDWTHGERSQDDDWWPDDPRVKIVHVRTPTDRYQAYFDLSQDYFELVSAWGLNWATDLVITARTQQVPSIRAGLSTVQGKSLGAIMRKVYLYEGMPMMDFKPFVATTHACQDMATLAGYVAADHVLTDIQTEHDGIMRTAREWLAPSRVLELGRKLSVGHLKDLPGFEVKDPKFRYDGKRTFNIGYTGRMTNTQCAIPDVYRIFGLQWIAKHQGRMQAYMMTGAKDSYSHRDYEFLKFVHYPRDEFWNFLRRKIDVLVQMTNDAGFSMGFLEPFVLGTPTVVRRKPWSEACLGKDYPYFVGSAKQANGVVQGFYDNYELCYERFLDWRVNVFEGMFEKGGIHHETDFRRSLVSYVSNWREEWRALQDEKEDRMKSGRLITTILESLDKAGEKEVFLQKMGSRLVKEGRAGTGLLKKFSARRREILPITRFMDFGLCRQSMMRWYGWEDASHVHGHMVKVDGDSNGDM